MNRRMLALFGGTFDPIHFGHLRAALEIFEHFKCDELRLIPSNHPPHREKPLAHAKARFEMLKRAVKHSPLTVDDCEIKREGPSYSVDTLRTLRQEYPEYSLNMVLGLDAFLKLPTWHEWEKLIELANIIVMHRAGWEIPQSGMIAELLEKQSLSNTEELRNFTAGKIVSHRITMLEISGTHIRTLLKAGSSVQFLLPETVLEYIQQQGLYQDDASQSFLKQEEET